MRNWKNKRIVGEPKVGIAVASFLAGKDYARRESALYCLVGSFFAQTYSNWQLLIVHDGPADQDIVDRFSGADSRISFICTKRREEKYGHPHRQAAVEKLLANGCDWIGLTNEDNYYVPTYLEWMLSVGTGGDTKHKKPCDFVYCNLVHSHNLWKPMTTAIRRRQIDLGCFLASKELVKRCNFSDHKFAGDWTYISQLSSKARGTRKVDATLMVHN